MRAVVYSIVVPCYASGEWLPEFVQRTAAAMTGHGPFEIILVNDNSPDAVTWPTIEVLSREYDFLRGIDLLYNVGQFKATLCGLDHARGEYVITMDDDFQHPPEELPKLIQAMQEHSAMDCVMGKYEAKQHSPLRNIGSRIYTCIMHGLYNNSGDIVTTSFRIMPVSFARTLTLYRTAHPQLGPLILSLTTRIQNVPVEHHARKIGKSGYSLAHCIRETFRSMINASIMPLRLFSLIGFVAAGIAFLTALYYFVIWLFGGVGVAGFTSLILTISFFSGMLLAGIGLLGEYIGRLIQEVTGMPRYQVKCLVGEKND